MTTHQVDLDKPLMPRAKAVWLIDNTALSFTQIGTFCDMHSVEVQALADEDVGRGMVGRSPIEDSELTQEEIDRCQKHSFASTKEQTQAYVHAQKAHVTHLWPNVVTNRMRLHS